MNTKPNLKSLLVKNLTLMILIVAGASDNLLHAQDAIGRRPVAPEASEEQQLVVDLRRLTDKAAGISRKKSVLEDKEVSLKQESALIDVAQSEIRQLKNRYHNQPNEDLRLKINEKAEAYNRRSSRFNSSVDMFKQQKVNLDHEIDELDHQFNLFKQRRTTYTLKKSSSNSSNSGSHPVSSNGNSGKVQGKATIRMDENAPRNLPSVNPNY